MMLLLACAKKLIWVDQGMRKGSWPDNRFLETTLSPVGSVVGERLGLVGMGSIGREMAKKAKAFGMHVSACTRHPEAPVYAELGVEPLPLRRLLEQSDYVSLHVPLNDQTRGLLGAEELRLMKPSAYLINTARGAVVDQDALITALQEKWIAGAGLDVFTPEPLPTDSPLLAMDNVVVTPHVASYSDAAFARMRSRVAEEVSMALRGQWPTAVVNPQVRGRSRLEAAAQQ
jgi:phosphoglycerate dehydrogenase-like enzyme